MVYKDYLKFIKNEPETAGLVFRILRGSIPARVLPFALFELEDKSVKIVKIPKYHLDPRHGYKRRVDEIVAGAFKGNTTVTDIFLSPKISDIQEGAFAGCSNLQRITIPRRIGKIRKGTFAGCDLLTDVYYEGSKEEWEKIWIETNERIIRFGSDMPGTPVRELLDDKLVFLEGNESLLRATIHFGCDIDLDPGENETDVNVIRP